MKAGNVILLAGALLGGYYFFDKSKQRQYTSGLRMQITGVRIQNARLVISFNIQNPNSAPTVVRSIVGDVSINGKRVGRVQAFKTVTIAGNAQSPLDVEVGLKLINTITTLAQLTQGVAGSTIKFSGTVNADNKPIQVEVQYEVTV